MAKLSAQLKISNYITPNAVDDVDFHVGLLYIPMWICYIFLISKCSGESDLGLCTTLGLIHVAFINS